MIRPCGGTFGCVLMEGSVCWRCGEGSVRRGLGGVSVGRFCVRVCGAGSVRGGSGRGAVGTGVRGYASIAPTCQEEPPLSV